MIRHLLKIVWNRKRINGLIMIEIFVSFIVLFVVVTAAAYYVGNYRKPLGYSVDHVWRVSANARLPEEGSAGALADGLHQIELALRDLPEIESVGWMWAGPYAHSTWTNGRTWNGQSIQIDVNRASDAISDVLNIQLVSGRWFSREDDASRYTPVVINERYARLVFGFQDPIGKSPLDSTCRVVGVMKDFRKAGEFSEPVNYQIVRFRMQDTTENHSGSFLVRVRDGTTAAFQGKLIGVLESVEKGWSFDIETLEKAREEEFKLRLAPVIAGGIIALFLLLMVALGLVGVLWQNVSQRTQEIGLRRAVGSTEENILWQIRGEQFVITTIGVIAGSVLVMQFPLLDLIGSIQPATYTVALITSLIIMYALTYLCSLFPSMLAADIPPAEALHYE